MNLVRRRSPVVPTQRALITALNGMSVEHDDRDTARIAGIIAPIQDQGHRAIVARTWLPVEQIDRRNGDVQHLATCEHNRITNTHRSPVEPDCASKAHALAGMLLG